MANKMILTPPFRRKLLEKRKFMTCRIHLKQMILKEMTDPYYFGIFQLEILQVSTNKSQGDY